MAVAALSGRSPGPVSKPVSKKITNRIPFTCHFTPRELFNNCTPFKVSGLLSGYSLTGKYGIEIAAN
jgi:hypothetical protein